MKNIDDKVLDEVVITATDKSKRNLKVPNPVSAVADTGPIQAPQGIVVPVPHQNMSEPAAPSPTPSPVENTRRGAWGDFGQGMAKVASLLIPRDNPDRRDIREARKRDRLDRAMEREEARTARIDARKNSRAIRAEEKAELVAAREEERNRRLEERANARDERAANRAFRTEERAAERAERKEARLAAREAAEEERMAERADREAAKEARIGAKRLARAERMDTRATKRAAREGERAVERAERVAERAELDALREERAAERMADREARGDARIDAKEERRDERLSAREERKEERGERIAERAAEREARKEAKVAERSEKEAAERASKIGGLKKLEMAGIDVSPTGDEPLHRNIDVQVPNHIPEEVKRSVAAQKRAEEDDQRVIDKQSQADSDAKRREYAEDMSEISSRYMMGPQATDETIDKSHSIYDIERENQKRRDAEKAIADYQGKEYARVMDSLKTDVDGSPLPIHEDVSIIDETIEEDTPVSSPSVNVPVDSPSSSDGGGQVRAEEDSSDTDAKSSSDWYSEYTKSLYSDADREADEKRRKAAKWITAAQMLGDSIGALSNVYWTGKGAQAMQTSPGAAKTASAAYQMEQDIRSARERAAKARLDATLKKYELEMQREREKKADERYEATQAENRRRYDNEVAYRRERDAIVDAREKELMEFRRQQENRIAKSSRGASTSTKDVEPIEFTLGDGETIGIDKFNKDKLNILYRSLPEDVRYATENEEVYNNGLSMGTRKRKVTDDDRLQAIYENLDNPEVAKTIRRLAGVEIEKAAAANTEAPKSVVVKDAHGNEYSVNPDFPVLGAAHSSMQTDEAKKHLNGIVISTGKKPVWQ